MISLSKKNISKYLLCFFLLLMTIFVMLLNNSGLNNYSTISIWIGFITNLVLIFISFYVNGIDFITRIFVQYKNLFFKYEFILMLSSIPRMVWYGRSYTYSSILFFVPILFIVNYFIDKYRI